MDLAGLSHAGDQQEVADRYEEQGQPRGQGDVKVHGSAPWLDLLLARYELENAVGLVSYNWRE